MTKDSDAYSTVTLWPCEPPPSTLARRRRFSNNDGDE